MNYLRRPLVNQLAAAISLLLAGILPAFAQTDTVTSVEDLAKLKQNPVSGLRQVGLDTTLAPDVPVTGGTEGASSLQVVWPFHLAEDWRLITYTILPVLQLPRENGGYTRGLGDTELNLFVSPAKAAGNFVWGAGSIVMLPTRTDSDLGSDRVGLGPSAVFYYAVDSWGAGVVLQNLWSLGGKDQNEVNEVSAQYFLNYNLANGWYIYSNATITGDWTANSDDRWTVPVGGGFGKVFMLGKQSMSASLQGLANVVRPDHSAEWAVNFQIQLLIP